MPRRPAPKLAVVASQPVNAGLPPPSDLGVIGAGLWRDITSTYAFEDRASYETLAQACAAADRAAACAEQIAADGVMIRSKAGMRAHPLLRDELANRGFVIRCLGKLGLDLEPTRPYSGRPPGVA